MNDFAIGILQVGVYMGLGAAIGWLFDAVLFGIVFGLAAFVVTASVVTARMLEELKNSVDGKKMAS